VKGAVLAASLLFAVALGGCGGGKRVSNAPIVVHASQWPQADVLFHRDPRWLGSDGAFSVPLHDGRILWLFNDTLVATTPAHVRSQIAFIRNSVAIERGTNPTSGSMTFYWGTKGRTPASFFHESGRRWFWPMHGVRLGRSLAVFLERVRMTRNPNPNFAYAADAWRMAVVRDATGSPSRWHVRLVTPPAALADISVGGSVNVIGGYAVSVATVPRGFDERGYLVRWRTGDLAAGRLGAAQWWAGRLGWVPISELRRAPTVVLTNAGTECSLTFDRKLDRWMLVRSEGFGATTIVVSFARAIEGPWSTPQFVYRPPESSRPDAFVYGAKGHPELRGADLVVTYATNTMARDAQLVLERNPSLYYPRFVRFTFSRS
jgi:hypothetical protein